MLAVFVTLAMWPVQGAPAGSRVVAPAPLVRRGVLSGWNVVVITLDATQAARLGVYGGSPKTTPFLDSLARRSLVIDHAYTITGSTAPAHATLLSGLLPEKHGVTYNARPLANDAFWLPEELQKRGYVTAGSTVAFFLQSLMARGFDHFQLPTGDDAATRPWSSNRIGYAPFKERCLPLLTADKPFSALIHLKGGHAPLAPVAKEFLRRHSPTLPPDRAPEPPDAEQLALGTTNAAAIRSDRLTYYDASLSEADATVEAILDDFKAWESTLRVPLMFYTENGAVPPGRIRDRIVSHADFVPTLGYLLGLPLPANEPSGVNLFAVSKRISLQAASVSSLEYERIVREMLNTPDEEAAARLRRDTQDLERTGIFYWARIEKRTDGVYKLLHLGKSSSRLLVQMPVQLYEVTAEPAEVKNLVESGAKKRLVAAQMLDSARKSDFLFGLFVGNLKGMESRPRDALLRSLDAETIARLKSLGYLQ